MTVHLTLRARYSHLTDLADSLLFFSLFLAVLPKRFYRVPVVFSRSVCSVASQGFGSAPQEPGREGLQHQCTGSWTSRHETRLRLGNILIPLNLTCARRRTKTGHTCRRYLYILSHRAAADPYTSDQKAVEIYRKSAPKLARRNPKTVNTTIVVESSWLTPRQTAPAPRSFPRFRKAAVLAVLVG